VCPLLGVSAQGGSTVYMYEIDHVETSGGCEYSSGPLETVVDGKTGFLFEPIAGEFAEKMVYFVCTPGAKEQLGKAGQQRVCSFFAFPSFTHKLNAIITQLAGGN